MRPFHLVICHCFLFTLASLTMSSAQQLPGGEQKDQTVRLEASKKYLRALQAGDGQALLSFCSKNEIEASKLTATKLRKLWELTLSKKLNSSMLNGTAESYMSSPRQAVSNQPFRLKAGGQEWHLSASLFQSKGEVFAAHMVLNMLVQSGWSPGRPDDLIKYVKALEPTLIEIGIQEVTIKGGKKTWKELISLLESEQSKARSNSQNASSLKKPS